MSLSLAAILGWLIHYGYFILLPIAIVEGPIITVMAGFLASRGYLNIVVVYIVVVVADLLGDLLYYVLGRFGKRGALFKWGRRLGATEERFKKLENYFEGKSGRILLFGKLTHSLGWMVLTAAGMAEVPIGEFLWFNLLGTLPKSLAFLLIGYYAGSAYQRIDSYIGKTALVVGVILVIGLGAFFLRKKFPGKSPDRT